MPSFRLGSRPSFPRPVPVKRRFSGGRAIRECGERLPMASSRLHGRRQRWIERLTLVRLLQTIVAAALLLAVLAGFLQWIVERKTFTSLGLSFWWAVGTVSTVGYGDVVPTTPAGRVIAAVLMLSALSLIPTLTSLAVSALISKRTREESEQMERDFQEMRAALRRIEERLTAPAGGQPS